MCSAVLRYYTVIFVAVYMFFFFQCRCFVTAKQFSSAEIASFNARGIV